MNKWGISTRNIVKAREKALTKSKDQSIKESFQVASTEENENEDRSKQEDIAEDGAEGKEDFFTNLGSKLEQLDNNIKRVSNDLYRFK